MKNKRAEFLKLKAMEAFQAAKFKRLKKIKSKRYRKILRKEKEKNEAKNMDQLEKEDPIKFKEVLEHLEKQRMKERMSLKHKNTSKWAKKQAVYAKYNEKVRDELQEQIQISKDLTKKIKQFEYADDDDEEDSQQKEKKSDLNPFAEQQEFATENGSFSSNPWMKMMSGVGGPNQIPNSQEETNENKSDEFSRPKAFIDKKEFENRKNIQSDEDEEDHDEDLIQKDVSEVVEILKDDEDEDENEEKEQDEKTKEDQMEKLKEKKIRESGAKKKVKKVSFESNLEEENKVKPVTSANSSMQSTTTSFNKKETNIQLITSNSLITSDTHEAEESNENKRRTNKRNAKEEKEHQLTLSEAFADDDVIDQFKAEKVNIFFLVNFFFRLNNRV
jgi:U3 small nucleolar RNA-associated protein 14